MTISQFLDAIEGTENWSDEDKKIYTLNHLKGQAELFSKQYIHMEMNWNDIKIKLFEHFKCQMSIWDKLEMKKNLVQSENETIKDFYNRCVLCQYLVCDDYSETVLDSQIMINFLLGMHKFICDKLHERLST